MTNIFQSETTRATVVILSTSVSIANTLVFVTTVLGSLHITMMCLILSVHIYACLLYTSHSWMSGNGFALFPPTKHIVFLGVVSRDFTVDYGSGKIV